jgi:TonB family protein
MNEHVRSVCGIVAALVFYSLAIVGCGSSPGPGPSAAAELFFTAIANGDMETAGKYAAPGTIKTVTAFGDTLQKAAQMASKITRSAETIDGGTATVALYFENSDPGEFKLVKIGGKWKVDIESNSGGWWGGERKILSPDELDRGGHRFVGARSRASVVNVIFDNMGGLRRAYLARLRDKPGLSGKIVVKFAIDEFGKVISAQIVESAIADPALEGAVVNIIKAWKFDKIDKPGDIAELTYTFLFVE